MSDFYVLLTDAGQALMAAATAGGDPVVLSKFGVDDGNGAAFTPDPAQIALINEVYQGDISSLQSTGNTLKAQLVIPKDSGGYTVRGFGLYTEDGTLFSICNFPPQEKPLPSSGYAVKMDTDYYLQVTDTSLVELQFNGDDYLTREEADTIYLQIANNLSEIKARGAAAQQVARDNLALGTAATATLTTSTTDSTVGYVLKVGDRGLGVIELPIIEGFDFKTYAFAGGETILIDLATAVNAPADIWSPSGWVYIHVTGVRNVYGDVSIQVTDFNTGNTTFFVCVSDSNNPRTWYKGGLRTGKISANEIQIENIDRATGNGLIAYYDTAGKLAFNFGYYQDMFSVNFYDETGAWVSNPFVIGRNGNATVSGNLSGGAVFDNGQRVYSPGNPQPIDLSAYATAAWVNTYFLQGVRLSGYSTRHFDPSLTFEDGAVFTYMDMVGGSSNVGDVGVRYIQQNIYGVWYTVSLESVSATRATPVIPVPGQTISTLSNFRLYQPAPDNDVLAELVSANPVARIPLYTQHFISEEGYDWYTALKHLTGNVFIAFDADGVIRQIEKDVSLIVPSSGRSVTGLDELPADANVRGSWKFDGTSVYQDADIVAARVLSENTSLRAKYASDAALAITTLQAGIDLGRSLDGDTNALVAWQGYLCDLRAMTPEQLEQSPASFPTAPANIF